MVIDDLSGTVGFTGAAHAGLLLASALDTAEAGAVIASLSLADGADALVFRATDALAAGRPAPLLADQIAAGGAPLPYPTFLTWRGLLRREPPRRPDPLRPTAPASHRGEAWKYAFSASRCQACGRRHLPPQRVCLECHAIDEMELERLADVPGTITDVTGPPGIGTGGGDAEPSAALSAAAGAHRSARNERWRVDTECDPGSSFACWRVTVEMAQAA